MDLEEKKGYLLRARDISEELYELTELDEDKKYMEAAESRLTALAAAEAEEMLRAPSTGGIPSGRKYRDMVLPEKQYADDDEDNPDNKAGCGTSMIAVLLLAVILAAHLAGLFGL